MISFINLLSCLRIPVDINTWRAAVGLFEKVSMGSSIFYLTKCLRCILYSFLYSIFTILYSILYSLFTVHFYDANLGLMAFLSLRVDSINMKGNLLSKFPNKCCTIPHACMFFFVHYYSSY